MILIVDDDNAVRMSLGLMLKQSGMEWKAVGNEADALAAVRTHEPEIVILDYYCPINFIEQHKN